MAAAVSVGDLPEELLVHIFDYLDSIAPSELKLRQEPGLGLSRNPVKVALKSASVVSKPWRRVALPLLFSHASLRLDTEPRPEWSRCTACAHKQSNSFACRDSANEQCHADMMDAIKTQRNLRIQPNILEQKNLLHCASAEDEALTTSWAQRFYHATHDFLVFIERNHLERFVRSITVSTDRTLARKLNRYPHQSRDWRFPAAAALWQALLTAIDPDRIVIVAPPIELACLTNAAIDTSGDWAFGDMSYHILELRHDRDLFDRRAGSIEYSKLRPFPMSQHTFAPASLLHQRQWTHVGLNEGSFLKAYGTYEFFERGPPSIVYSIKQCLARWELGGHNSVLKSVPALPALRSFSYTAIFPFASHADFSQILPHVEVLDLQFAPDPQSGILDDKERTGKAELQDCWQELVSAYHDLAVNMQTHRMTAARFPKLEKFICRDYRTKALQDDLDEVFTSLCLPVWVEYEPGHFSRVAMSYELPNGEHAAY